jgi:dTDP-4-dehydrorhamnose reductase
LIFEILKNKNLDLKTQSILPINSEFLSQLATRPKNSCLNNQKLKSLLNINMHKWTELLDNELQNL